jgi:tetratricopeptide (TPR) repeat protein
MSPEEITEKAVRAATRMYLADRPQVALDYLDEALEADPECYEALVMAGEVHDRWGPELGMEQREAALMAISFYDRAIAAQPDHAEAYAEKLLPLLDLDEYEAAIQCADRGLELFDTRPTTDEPPDVWTNIGESLYGRKAEALRKNGQVQEGRCVLDEGLRRFPNSEYLTHYVEKFLPEL